MLAEALRVFRVRVFLIVPDRILPPVVRGEADTAVMKHITIDILEK